MEQRPSMALRVHDVAASVAFYTKLPGFTVGSADQAADLATILDPDGDAFLLTGPIAGDVTPYLSDVHQIFRPGATFVFSCRNLAEQQDDLVRRGLDVQEIQRPWGDPALRVQDSDGYMILFTVPRQFSQEECLALYARGLDELDSVLEKLSEQELDLTRADEEWSIRQIVHHIADGDDLWTMAIKAALSNSGCLYRHDWYTPDNVCAESLDYAGRAIEPAIALFRAHRAYVLQLVHHLPNAWERSIRFAWPWEPEPSQITVGRMIDSQARHALAHCDEIRQIRQVHGR